MKPRGHSNSRYTYFGVGTILAICISWKLNASIWWAILHGFLGWIYIIYWFVFYSPWAYIVK